jgi:molecular chaperone DnaK
LDRAVAGAGLTINQIDHLIMVGGTSRLPYIQDAVAQHTGLAPKTDIDPEKAIAYGAALASLSELARQGRNATIRGQVIPAPNMFVREVTAHPVGCCVVDTSIASRRLSNSVIIPRNTPIPCRKTDRFFLEHADQPQARIEILQGDSDANRDDCLLIGELLLDDLPEEDRATARIEVEYVIDGNGMVTATATDLVSNKQQTVSVDYKKGIKASEKPAAA